MLLDVYFAILEFTSRHRLIVLVSADGLAFGANVCHRPKNCLTRRVCSKSS